MAEQQNSTGINKQLAKPLVLTAGIIGLLQGLAWTVFSVLCICCYYEVIKGPNSNDLYISNDTYIVKETSYYKLIYVIFLHEPSILTQEVIINPDQFFIFMWFYLVFSAIWAITSGTIIWAMMHDQWQLSKRIFGGWSITTILISIVDIVLTSLIVADYITINNLPTSILTCYGIVMSLAARGYILWIINVIFAGILMNYTINIVLKQNKEPTMPIIRGYEPSGTHPPWFNNEVKDYWENTQSTYPPIEERGMDRRGNNGYDNHGFERSQSFLNSRTTDNLYTQPPTTRNNQTSGNNPSSFSEAIRTATIGKTKERRSPLYHTPPPIIPPPDYTPPNSPNALKSVLRSQSNYTR